MLKDSRPWVTISPAAEDATVNDIDWSQVDVVKIDPARGYAVLPSEWDDDEDEGLYDDLI